MGLIDVQATKHKLATAILDNPTYTPESGVWCRLYNKLMSLAKDDLASLKLLIDLKVQDAVENADKCPACLGTGHVGDYQTCPTCQGTGGAK